MVLVSLVVFSNFYQSHSLARGHGYKVFGRLEESQQRDTMSHITSLTGKPATTQLLFLAGHDLKNFPFKFNIHQDLVQYPSSSLTITGQTIAITVGATTKFNSNGNYSEYSLLIPSGTYPGTLYINKNIDPTVKFIAQQFPTFFGEPGRVVVEFWNANGDISALFKSDASDFYATGPASYTG